MRFFVAQHFYFFMLKINGLMHNFAIKERHKFDGWIKYVNAFLLIRSQLHPNFAWRGAKINQKHFQKDLGNLMFALNSCTIQDDLFEHQLRQLKHSHHTDLVQFRNLLSDQIKLSDLEPCLFSSQGRPSVVFVHALSNWSSFSAMSSDNVI